jgi:hypothetical protein
LASGWGRVVSNGPTQAKPAWAGQPERGKCIDPSSGELVVRALHFVRMTYLRGGELMGSRCQQWSHPSKTGLGSRARQMHRSFLGRARSTSSSLRQDDMPEGRRVDGVALSAMIPKQNRLGWGSRARDCFKCCGLPKSCPAGHFTGGDSGN